MSGNANYSKEEVHFVFKRVLALYCKSRHGTLDIPKPLLRKINKLFEATRNEKGVQCLVHRIFNKRNVYGPRSMDESKQEYKGWWLKNVFPKNSRNDVPIIYRHHPMELFYIGACIKDGMSFAELGTELGRSVCDGKYSIKNICKQIGASSQPSYNLGLEPCQTN